jgi:hypothetical protein
MKMLLTAKAGEVTIVATFAMLGVDVVVFVEYYHQTDL